MTEYEHIIQTATDQARNSRRIAVERCERGAYVYYKPGAIGVFNDEPSFHWKLAFAEPLTTATPFSSVYQWLWNHCRQVPCLKT